MERDTYNQLLQTVHKYYPLGSPGYDGWNVNLQNIVADKIDGKSVSIKEWDELVKTLRDNGLKIENRSYTQFPNLMLVLENFETIDNITVCKNFVICLSLLCPFYTYYYEYKHKVRVTGGLLSFNSFIFLNSKQFEDLRIPLDIGEINRLIHLHYPEYSFAYHYGLMSNKIVGGIPYGVSHSEGNDYKFSFYEFLFSNQQLNSEFIEF